MTIKTNPINKLKNLNLSKYPVDEINSIMKEFGKFGVVVMTLHEGKSIIRARPNERNETFNTVSELSYKPAKFNTTFQRASTKNTTMFYGCVVPENIADGELDNARVTAIFEASKLYRQEIESGEEKITFSRWIVTKDIPLIAIVYHKDFINNSSHTNELHKAYQAFLENNPQDIENSNIVTEYLASEFAKKETPNDYDYLISALFTELVLSKGFAGVYYPSVRAEGKGFNVAIHPDFVNSNMKAIVSGECSLYKKAKHIVLDNDTITNIAEGKTEFIMQPITDPQFHSGREICNKILNGEIKV
jgi:hypothetical protein